VSDFGFTLVLGVFAVFLWLIAFATRAMASTHSESHLLKWRSEVLGHWGFRKLQELEMSERVYRLLAGSILALAVVATGVFAARLAVHAIEGAQ